MSSEKVRWCIVFLDERDPLLFIARQVEVYRADCKLIIEISIHTIFRKDSSE